MGAGPNYFRTMGIRLLRGRGVLPTDDSRAPKVAIVDELLARRYFAGRDAIGQRFTFGFTPDRARHRHHRRYRRERQQGGLAANALPEL